MRWVGGEQFRDKRQGCEGKEEGIEKEKTVRRKSRFK
jgi:hypothetical protein